MIATWNRRELADAIVQTRNSSTFQGIGPHPVALADVYWEMIVTALRETARAEERRNVVELAHLVALDIAELPDRTSPDDKPEQMLVTEPELVRIIERHFGPDGTKT